MVITHSGFRRYDQQGRGFYSEVVMNTLLSRATSIDDFFTGKFIKYSRTTHQEGTAQIKERMTHMLAEYSQASTTLGSPDFEHYTQPIPGVFIDTCNILECLGAFKASCKHQNVYELSDWFGEMLAFLCGESDPEFPQKLKQSVKDAGYDWYLLSRGFCTGVMSYISQVPLSVFNGVSSKLEEYFTIIAMRTRSSHLESSVEDRVVTTLVRTLLVLQQYILDEIIHVNLENHANDGVFLLSSKGASNIVFQAQVYKHMEPFPVEFEGGSSILIVPSTYVKRQFINFSVKRGD